MKKEYTDLQLEEASFELGWFMENNIISEIEESKELIKFLQSRKFGVEMGIGRKWFYDWVDDGIKKSHQNIASLSEDLNKLLIKRTAKL